jgi:hypothetical protein
LEPPQQKQLQLEEEGLEEEGLEVVVMSCVRNT